MNPFIWPWKEIFFLLDVKGNVMVDISDIVVIIILHQLL